MLSTTLSGNYGFPLCISGISQHLSLSKEMVDHEKRRKEMKRRRRSEGEIELKRSDGEEEEMGVERFDDLWWLQEVRQDGEVRDLVALLEDLGSFCFSSHAAKAV